jgi:hypothetical protein
LPACTSIRPPTAAFITKVESSLLNGVLFAGVDIVELLVAVLPVVSVELALVVESELAVDSPLLLHDHMTAADRQRAKENNFFFIKWF